MLLKTRCFGEVEIKKEEIIKFTQPIVGFDEYKQYILMKNESIFPTFWLQSVDNPALAFPVVSPFVIDENYSIKLSVYDFEDINLKEFNDVIILTLLVVPQDLSLIRTNLRAPIIYNPMKKLAKQIVLQEEKYPVHFYVMDNN
ncbi:MAG: flagellar assembly protein FliW [Candidatus Scalindua sediminis]|nr:flagellar assembly protein FliW [Candidatus Scalindua sediminis]